jgi:hypothetical protein
MTWMLTRSGTNIDLRYIRPLDIDVLDIAHALAQLNRFTGMASRPYSVAEHSLFVEALLRHSCITDPSVLLAGLMHDGHEAYFGDMSSPLKQMLSEATGGSLKLEERRLQMAVMNAFHLKTPFHVARKQIHSADMTALSTERHALMPEHEVEWPCTLQFMPVAFKDFAADGAHPWTYWRDRFLQRFAALNAAREQLAAAIPRAHPA